MTSSPEYTLEISDEAYDDLVHIQHYTYSVYGEDRWRAYGRDLDKALRHITNHSLSGHIRNDMPEIYRAWSVNEHIMVYRPEGRIIYLIRVLHSKMDFRFQF